MNKKTLLYTIFGGLAGLLFTALSCCLTGCAGNKKTNTKEAAEWAEKTLAGLTLEKKVAQLICTDISGNYLPEDDSRFETWLKRFNGVPLRKISPRTGL